MELNERLEKMRAMRSQGYNCTQSLIACFPELTGMADEDVIRITNAMGSGVAGMREICGVPNAIAMVVGMQYGTSPDQKVLASKEARALCEQFASLNGERIRCADLKGVQGVRPCNELIAQGIEILHNHYCK